MSKETTQPTDAEVDSAHAAILEASEALGPNHTIQKEAAARAAPARRPAVPAQTTSNGPLTLCGTTDPDEIIAAASRTAEALTKILEERHLYAVMGHKPDGTERRHVQIEGWALLGSMTGIFAATTWTREILDNDGRAAGWEARAEAHTLAGNLVGAAEAECRWAEDKWYGRDSYALRSMAQTRAQSKALAMPLRFIVELAGFNGTPAEEMVKSEEPETSEKCPACDGPLWDNRTKNDQREADGKHRMPEYKCRNQKCSAADDGGPWITWDAHHFVEPSIRAKQNLTAVVAARKNLWKLYYPLDDPSYSDDGIEATLIASIHESDDGAQMAGKLWTDIVQSCLLEEPTENELRQIVVTARIVLDEVGEDATELVSFPEAWEQAEEQMADADADATGGLGSDYYG